MSITLNQSQREILEFLLITPAKENEYSGKTINEISDAVELSTNAVRKYLTELEKHSLIENNPVNRKKYVKIQKSGEIFLKTIASLIEN